MVWIFLGVSLVAGIVTGFAIFSRGSLFHSMSGQIIQGVLSLACFALVGAAFWKFGWMIGVIEIFLILLANQIGWSIFKAGNRKWYSGRGQ